MVYRRNHCKYILILMIFLAIAIPFETNHYGAKADEQQSYANEQWEKLQQENVKIQDHLHEVIVKWKSGTSLPSIPGTDLIIQDEDERLAKLAVHDGVSVQEVVAFADTYAELEYIQPNYRYRVQAIPNDPEFPMQWHHQSINLPRAWDLYKGNGAITIAVLDTGVDLTHPDLMPNLVKGYNVIHPQESAQDDYGHGTQVAGLLAAVGNNGSGGAGVLWNAQIMPVKVLDRDGEGDDFSIGQGIRYAVRNGAKIIVMSLGDRLYSKHMDEAVTYAESAGVLLVAATGNNGSTVNYPAAFPTVLAVGAHDADGQVPGYSNFGSEIDVVAPGQGMYTTTLGGQMVYNSGTSMAAPIVAGVAALIYNKYPDMEPWQVRQLIRQSAISRDGQAWDEKRGYGRIDAYRALTLTPEMNLWAPNRTWQQAKVFPAETTIHSALKGVNDSQWFYIDVKYSGRVQTPFESSYKGIGVTWYRHRDNGTESGELTSMIYSSSRALEPGRYYINIQVNYWPTLIEDLQSRGIRQNQYATISIPYTIGHQFLIAEDRYEGNQTIQQAAVLDIYQADNWQYGQPSLAIEGTFDRTGDYDWYRIDLPQDGDVVIEVINRYGRMDPVLMLSSTLTTDSKAYTKVDDHAHGAGEFWQGQVSAGSLYFMVADYQLRSHPVPYQIKITYTPTYGDRWEPNNRRQDAPVILKDYDLIAFLNGNDDQDWYVFTIEEPMQVGLELTAFMPESVLRNTDMTVRIFESTKEVPTYTQTMGGRQKLTSAYDFTPGVYYIQISKNDREPFKNRRISYQLQLFSEVKSYFEINNNNRFTDIIDQEVSLAVSSLVDNGIIQGYPDRTFRPQQTVTRGELAAMILRAVGVTIPSADGSAVESEQPNRVIVDTDASHWAYPSISKAIELGIMIGFEDQTMRPDQPVTRGQLAVMLYRAFEQRYEGQLNRPEWNQALAVPVFQDVMTTHWAYREIQSSGLLGYLVGIDNQTFAADIPANREQVAMAIYKILQ